MHQPSIHRLVYGILQTFKVGKTMSYTTHLWMVYTYTTYKNGDDWETVYGIVLPRRFTSQHHPRLGSRSQLSPDFHRRIAQEGAKLQGHTALLAAGNIWNPRECWPFTFWIFQDLQKKPAKTSENTHENHETPAKNLRIFDLFSHFFKILFTT